MNRFLLLGLAVLLIVVLWTGGWFWAAGQISASVKSLETADGVTTPRLTCGQFSVGGYPFGFDVTCTDATVISSDTTVTVAGLKASALVYNPTHVLVFAQSPLSIADAFTGSSVRLDFADAELSARLDGWRIGRVSLVAEGIVANDTILEDRLIGKASHLEAHLVDVPQDHDAVQHLASLAEYIKIDGVEAPGYEITAGTAILEGKITKIGDDVRLYGEPDVLKAWQAAGGQFTLLSLRGNDGDTKFETSGNLGLDEQGRYEGQFKINSTGVVERLGTLVPAEMRGLLFGVAAEDGSYSQTINIRAGLIFAGLVPAGMLLPAY